jgi:hypothetical protein
MPQEQAGVAVQDLERRPAPQASAWLFTAAIINLLGYGALIVLGPLLVSREQLKADFIPDLLLIGVMVLLVFAGLAWWARSQPVMAVAAGVVVYLGLSAVEVVLVPGGMTLLGLPVKIVVLALLIQALRASRKPGQLAV